MRHLRWQALIALLGLLLAAGLLAGQGRAGPEALPTAAPQPGGTYSEALIGAPRALNPLLDAYNPVDRDIDRLIFSGLTRFDSFGRPIPDLAYWNVSADQLTYTFILKPGLTWHDGRPVTAADVDFTVRLMQSPDYPGPPDLSQFWRGVSVAISGTQIVEFALTEPFAPFLDYTAFGLLPQHLLDDAAPARLADQAFNLRPVGTGPFLFDRWLVEGGQITGVVLTAFPGYAGQRPNFDQVEFHFYLDEAAAFEAYQAGQVLGVSRLGEGQLPTALRLPALGLHTTLRPEYSAILLNLRDETLPFFREKKVRQALLFGLNRERMVADLLGGQAVVAASPVVPGSWAHNPALSAQPYDPAQAVGLLESAGWLFPEGALAGTESYVRQKDGVSLAFALTVTDAPLDQAVAQSAQTTWAALGIRVIVQTVPAERLQADHLEPRAFQAALVTYDLTGTPDPDPYPFWHETQVESGQNYAGLNDRSISQYLEQARIIGDIEARARLYQSFQSRFADQVPALLLFYPVYTYGVDRQVGGVRIGALTEPSDRFQTLADWFLESRRAVVETTPTP